MIFDCFTYNGEADLLEIRLNILSPFVDTFIIVEAPTTFSGKVKPLYFEEQKDRFKRFFPKIKYWIIDERYSRAEIELAKHSPNTRGASHWTHEFLQKEKIKDAMRILGVRDTDTCIIGDVDEIWNPDILSSPSNPFCKLQLAVYTYYLNNRSSEVFYGPIICSYSDIKYDCLNEVRTCKELCLPGNYGWHFTSMGGLSELTRKLQDSYTTETYADERVIANLPKALENSTDFLGRGFAYTLDEKDWPQWLKNNRDKYAHLCR